MGQPTHFLPGRHVGMFTVTVPKSFTKDQKLTWTITVNGQTNTIPLRMHLDYNVSPFRIQHSADHHNTPPIVRFEEKGATVQGPIAAMSRALTRTTSLSAGLPLTLWADDDAQYSTGSGVPPRKPPPPVTLFWSHYRGPGKVTFDKARPAMENLAGGNVGEPYRGKATATAKFSEPGNYVLHVAVNDYTGDGGGGEVCCWTTALVQVNVTN
jgi:hypothetical protein